MGFFEFLSHWWNFPFVVMLGLVVVFFILQLVGMLGDHDHDHEVDHDHDVDADHDADADADADADSGFSWGGVLSFFGVGRVPFMVIWVSLFLFGGFTGIALNRIFYVRQGGRYDAWFFAVAMGAAVVVGLVGVRLFSRLAARFVDTGGKGSTAKNELCGKVGVVASAKLDESFGQVRVHDAQGTEILVHARIKGEAALERGKRVVLVDYDEKTELFWATASPAEAEAQA